MKIEQRPKKYSLQITTESHQRRRIPDGWRQTVSAKQRHQQSSNMLTTQRQRNWLVKDYGKGRCSQISICRSVC